MICSVCNKNQATFHMKNNINGVITDRYICKECHDMMFGQEYNTALTRFIKSVRGSAGTEKLTPEIKCAVCGTKLSEILETFYAGCPNCYREFSERILPSIKTLQNSVLHEGKRPLSAQEAVTDEYERLRNELNKAISQENYEQAAIISARLKQLRCETNE